MCGILNKRDKGRFNSGESQVRNSAYTCFFMHKAVEGGCRYKYKNVARWGQSTPVMDIFQLKHLIMPIKAGGNHWFCITINFENKQIKAFNSRGDD